MRSINKATIIGNLGRDPEMKYTSDGRPVTRFSVATTDQWKSRDGERREKTQWHRSVAWGKLAEICNQYLKKGRQVYIEGRIETRNYEDRDHNQRTITEIIANEMMMLGSRAGGDIPHPADAPPAESPQGPMDATNGDQFKSDDDVPF